MKPLLTTLVFLIAFLPISYGQSADAAGIKNLLQPGIHQAKIFAAALPVLTPEEQALQAKITKVMMDHASWFRDSISGPEDMEKMLGKAGITSQELDEYMKMGSKSGQSYRITGTDSFQIIQKGNIISFHGYGRLGALDSLRIDLDANKAVFRGQDMTFKGVTDKKSIDGPLKSALKGYEYAYESAIDPMVDVSHVIDNMVNYSLDVGRIESTGELVLMLMALKNVDKRMVLNVTVPVFFK